MIIKACVKTLSSRSWWWPPVERVKAAVRRRSCWRLPVSRCRVLERSMRTFISNHQKLFGNFRFIVVQVLVIGLKKVHEVDNI